MRLSPEERKLMTKAVKQGKSINLVADFFGVTRQTVWYWKSETLNSNFEDLPRRNQRGKINIEAEMAIIYMRLTFKWGTARIQQGLINLPDFMLEKMEVKVQNFRLSRTSINYVLKKHKINGYRRKKKSWKFFRAKKSNELWQADLKEFKLEGKKYYILVCIDDYSRFILCLKLFNHCPTTNELISALEKLDVKPKKILVDNGGQFQEQWKKWCREKKIKALFAHPNYPQDKGKVERAIRNLAEEFVNLLARFPHWIEGKIQVWRKWFNEKRWHRGIKNYPNEIYVKL